MRTRTMAVAVVVATMACDRSTSAPTPAPSASPSAMPTPSPTPSPTPMPMPSASMGAKAETKIDFDADPVGAPPPEFEAVVGDWSIASENGAVGLKVDGSNWRNGTPSASLADQAKKLYGDRYAEFLDGVKAFAFFPFAVWNRDPPAGDVRVSVRFYPEAGKIDQGAGIVYDVEPNGSYWGVRANALEDNLLFFQVVKGHRTVLENVRNVPTPSKTWHTLVVEIRGTKLVASLDDQKRLERTLDAPPKGRLGLWSKADSQVLFDDFTVTPLGD